MRGAGKHRRRVPWYVALSGMLLAALLFLAGALANGLVGLGLDRTAEDREANARQRTGLNVDVYSDPFNASYHADGAPDVVVPIAAREVMQGALPDAASSTSFLRWAEERDGTFAGATRVIFTVSSAATEPAVIRGVRVVVQGARRPPMDGTRVRWAGAGGFPTRALSADLDHDPVRYEFLLGEDGEQWGFPLQVGDGSDMEYFSILVHSETCDCRFTIEIDYSLEGREDTYVLDRSGKGFRVAAVSAASDLVWMGPAPDGTLRWLPAAGGGPGPAEPEPGRSGDPAAAERPPAVTLEVSRRPSPLGFRSSCGSSAPCSPG